MSASYGTASLSRGRHCGTSQRQGRRSIDGRRLSDDVPHFVPPCEELRTQLSSSLFVPVYGPSLLCSVLEAIQSASDARTREVAAASTIQATFRMHQKRQIFVHIQRSVTSIQKIFRAYRERKAIRSTRVSEEVTYQRAVFDYYASRIQACFRGYYARQHGRNFYAQREYLLAVQEQSNAVMEIAAQFCKEQQRQQTVRERESRDTGYIKATEQVHHLISTVSVSGVYRGCTEAVGAATCFGTNVEDDIRVNARRARRGDLERKIGRNTCSTVIDHSDQKAKEAPLAPVATRSRKKKDRGTKASVLPAVSASQQSSQSAAHSPTPAEVCGVQQAVHTFPAYKSGGGRSFQCAIGSSQVPTCQWENRDALPPQRPLIGPSNKISRKAKGFCPAFLEVGSTMGKESGRALVGSGVSSFHPRFSGRSHHCGSEALQSTYNTKESALQRDVDAKLIYSLHGTHPFVVPSKGKMV